MKLLGAFITVALLTCGLGLEGVLTMRGLAASIDDLGNNRLPSVENLFVAREAGVGIGRLEYALLSTAATDDERAAAYQGMEQEKAARAAAVKAFAALPQTPEESGLLAQFERAEEAWWAEHLAYLQKVRSWEKSQSDNDYANAAIAALEANEKGFLPAQKILNELVRINTVASNTASAAALSSAASSRTFMLVLMAVATLLALGLGVGLSENIARALSHIADAMRTGSEQVAAASTQVSSASQQLANSATTQAANLEEVSSSLEEVTSMTSQNAESARRARDTAAQASADATRGDEAMNRMKDAIGKIQTSARETAKIVKAIDEIAFQTNLLALNAAVEAARAGEAGKGFAVVAEEVRSLAQRSAEAARTTSALIEDSHRNAEGGVAVSGQVQQVLVDIIRGADAVQKLVGEVAQASDQQSTGVREINTAVTQMDRLTQSTAANAEQSASASEQLSAQATELNGMVGDLMRVVFGKGAGQPTGATGRPPPRRAPTKAAPTLRAVNTPPRARPSAPRPSAPPPAWDADGAGREGNGSQDVGF
jgi:methyl-accepting chemotaxis protein